MPSCSLKKQCFCEVEIYCHFVLHINCSKARLKRTRIWKAIRATIGINIVSSSSYPQKSNIKQQKRKNIFEFFFVCCKQVGSSQECRRKYLCLICVCFSKPRNMSTVSSNISNKIWVDLFLWGKATRYELCSKWLYKVSFMMQQLTL